MICNNCGMAVGETVKFCGGCGRSIAPYGSAAIQTEAIDTTATAGTSLTSPMESQPFYYPQQSPYQYQMQANGYARPAMPYVKRKEPAVALLLSFFLPGVGQIYNGDIGKGIAFMIGFWVLVWIGIGLVFWIWAMIDAYQSATNINLGRRL